MSRIDRLSARRPRIPVMAAVFLLLLFVAIPRPAGAQGAVAFSVACNPSSLSVTVGGTVVSTCTVTSLLSFSSPVALSCANLPSNVFCAFNPASVTPPPGGNVSSTLLVSAGPTTPGTFPFQVKGVHGTAVGTTDLSLHITAASVSTVFSDNFESNKGWVVNPNGTDTASGGQWERGNPEQTSSGGVNTQLGTTPSGSNDLVTGKLAGIVASSYDVDGGKTSIWSPPITLPASGNLVLSLKFYFAHLSNATGADFFAVRIVSGGNTTTLFQELGSATNDAASFTSILLSLNSYAGQTIRVLFEASDGGTASLIEAAVDDVKITAQ